jgi:hypothetical protein
VQKKRKRYKEDFNPPLGLVLSSDDKVPQYFDTRILLLHISEFKVVDSISFIFASTKFYIFFLY